MRSLNEQHHNFTRKLGGVVELQCETKTVQRILRIFPKASYRWIHNGSPLKMDASRMRYQMGELVMSNLIPTDTGVFVCQIEYEPGQVKTVAIFSLFVKASKGFAIHVQQTKDVKLQCNSAALGNLFDGSKRSWKHNNKVVTKAIHAWNRSEEVFRNAHQNVTGNWTCIVHQPITARYWTTAYYTVILDPPPTAMENAMSFFKKYIIYFIAFCAGIVCFVVVILVALARHFEKLKKQNEEEMLMIAQQFLDEKDATDSSSDDSESEYDSTDDEEK
ncbi:hypothetical protein FSP39_025042 [Pinctada imbricata]|uniref:Ig-like domain-containing protein n=1 Tax=Pinctada imbricata TaxID=66713 RepID=A0AA89C7L4_PINIB|nr:hypothetical protein FSP39_025042 [Pinctada imbricata]